MQSRSTPYHPQGNNARERFNRIMIKTVRENEEKDWNRHLSKLAFAYNVTVNRSTGFSPHFLMFGREPRLPIDSVFQVSEGEKAKMRKSHEAYADEWQKLMNQAFEIVKKNKEKSSNYNKKCYDKKSCGATIDVGDRVLSRNREKGGTGNLRSFWEDIVYKVVKMDTDIPVIVIKPEKGGKEKRVYRNDLLKCNLILPDPACEIGCECDLSTLKTNKLKRSKWDPRSILACIAGGSHIFANYSLSVDAVLCDKSSNTQRIYRANWLSFSSIISTCVCVIARYTG